MVLAKPFSGSVCLLINLHIKWTFSFFSLFVRSILIVFPQKNSFSLLASPLILLFLYLDLWFYFESYVYFDFWMVIQGGFGRWFQKILSLARNSADRLWWVCARFEDGIIGCLIFLLINCFAVAEKCKVGVVQLLCFMWLIVRSPREAWGTSFLNLKA